MIIFYADNQRYDIDKLRQFIEEGRSLLAEHGPIKKNRLKVEFGGFRNAPEVEFWIVPKKE